MENSIEVTNKENGKDIQVLNISFYIKDNQSRFKLIANDPKALQRYVNTFLSAKGKNTGIDIWADSIIENYRIKGK